MFPDYMYGDLRCYHLRCRGGWKAYWKGHNDQHSDQELSMLFVLSWVRSRAFPIIRDEYKTMINNMAVYLYFFIKMADKKGTSFRFTTSSGF